jgi:hypothetical protein
MDLLDRLSTGGFVRALPLVVMLLFLAASRLLAKRGRTNMTDSPWFWAFAFSGIGLLGVWAISSKYDDRQKRVEARYEGRERIAAKLQGASVPAEDLTDLQAGYSTERRVPLHFLAAGLMIVSVVSLFMLSRTGRKLARTDRPKVLEPQSR